MSWPSLFSILLGSVLSDNAFTIEGININFGGLTLPLDTA